MSEGICDFRLAIGDLGSLQGRETGCCHYGRQFLCFLMQRKSLCSLFEFSFLHEPERRSPCFKSQIINLKSQMQ